MHAEENKNGTNGRIVELLSGIADSLREVASLVRFGALRDARVVLGESLADEADRRVYQLSTGLSSREVASVAGVDSNTVSRRWKAWAALGIVEEDRRIQGRFRRVFDLNAFGLGPSASTSKGEKRGKQDPSQGG